MKAVAYLRVSDTSQIDGHSLDAQERLFKELCQNREWQPVDIYREEGRSAHTDKIAKRPVFQQLLHDAESKRFDVIVVHTLDRWARNLKVLTETFSILGQHGVGIVSITENIDYSTPQGRLFTQLLGSFAEYYSGSLSTHIKKGIGERAHKGRHLGGIPFGYQSCRPRESEERGPCDPEHLGGLHQIPDEADAVRTLFKRYAKGTETLAGLARSMNRKGFITRSNNLFSTASVRGILHNVFYAGRIRHNDKLLPGSHEALVSQDLFETVQVATRKNSGRSETLSTHPDREYLLKGIIKCAYCGGTMWAQTLNSNNAYYREQKGSRTTGRCEADGKSVRCDVPDEQMGRIIGALTLPESWLDRVLATVHLEDEVERIREDREETSSKLQRIARTYEEGLKSYDDYSREKRQLEERLDSLFVPGVAATEEAGRLLEDLPRLWAKATLGERHRLLMTMLDAVYVDAVEMRVIVAIKPKPAFRPLFEVATWRAESGIVVYRPEFEDNTNVESTTSCLWWRRGGVDLPRKHDLEVILLVA